MRKSKLYLDTSIINFALAEDISEERLHGTKRLCEEINQGKYEGFISDVVLREIAETPDPARRKALADFITGLILEETLEVTKEVERLAVKYVDEGIIPTAHSDDALHIALASVNDMDIVVSWNFEHIVRHKTRVEVNGVNKLLGYQEIDICTPLEVIEDV